MDGKGIGPQVFINNKGIQREYLKPTGEPDVQYKAGHCVTVVVPSKKPFTGDSIVLETGHTFIAQTPQKP